MGLEVSRPIEPAKGLDGGTRSDEVLSALPGSGTQPTVPPTTAPLTTVPPTTVAPPDPPVGTFVAQGSRLGVGGCPLFPDDNAFHASIGALAVRADSSSVISSLAESDLVVRAGFTSGVWAGSRSGIPVNLVDSRTAQSVDFLGGEYAYLSELDGHPIPANPRFEGWPGIAWDRHLLVVDTATCVSSEFFYVTPGWSNPFGSWVAQSAVKLDLTTNAIRSAGTTVASGFSMLSGMVRYDEVAAGRIAHAISISIPKIKAAPPVWPASKTDGTSPDPTAPAMGTWFRLRDDVDISGLGPQAQVVARALKEHGAIVSDTNHHDMALSGEPDLRWDDNDLRTLQSLDIADFEAVDATEMQVDPSTLQIR